MNPTHTETPEAIEALIGWRDRQDYRENDRWQRTPWFHRPTCGGGQHPDHCVSCCKGATVDDLLAWLIDEEHGYEWVKVGNYTPEAGGGWLVQVFNTGVFPGDMTDVFEESAPTLLEALSAAVRAVVASEQTTAQAPK